MSHGEITHELTQVLTGHECFQECLHRICKELTPTRVMCDSEQEGDAKPTVFRCQGFSTKGQILKENLR